MEWLENRVVALEGRVDKHDKDLYVGNGRPSLTTRTAIMEECYERLQSDMKSIKRNNGAMILLLLTILGGVIADMVRR